MKKTGKDDFRSPQWILEIQFSRGKIDIFFDDTTKAGPFIKGVSIVAELQLFSQNLSGKASISSSILFSTSNAKLLSVFRSL